MWTQGGLAMPTDTKQPTKQKYANETDAMATTNSNFHFSMRDWRGHLHLCSAAQKVFVALCLRASLKFGAWTCIPGYDLLARDTGLSLRRVQDMVKLLVAKGFILLERRRDKFGGDLANRYELPAERMWAEGRKNFLAEKEITDDKRKEKAEKLAAFRGADAAVLLTTVEAGPTSADEQVVLDDLGSTPQSVAGMVVSAATKAPATDAVIDVAAADFNKLAADWVRECGLDNPVLPLLFRRTYRLVLEVYRLTGRKTVTQSALDEASNLAYQWVTIPIGDGTIDVSDKPFDALAARIEWACTLAPKYADWIKAAPDPVKYIDAAWGNAKDDNKLGQQSMDRLAGAQKRGMELVPGLVPATEAFPELSFDDDDADGTNGITDEDIAA